MRNLSLFTAGPASRSFLLVWFGQFVSLLGSGLTDFALGIWIYQRTGSPTQYVLSVVCLVLPRVLLAPLAGAVADRHERRLVMLWSDLAAGALTCVVAVLLWQSHLQIWQVYLAISLGSICGAFQRPAYAAAIGTLLPPEQLGRANGLVSLAQASSSLIAPLLAGALVATTGLLGVLLIDMATFLVAVATLLVVRFPALPPDTTPHEERSFWQDTGAGWAYMRGRAGLLALFIFMAAAGLLGITTEVLLTPYMLAFASVESLGLVVAAGGAGLLAGGLLLSLWGGPRRMLVGVLGCELLISLCTVLLGLQRVPLLLAGTSFVYFAAVALGDGCGRTLIQRVVDPAYQGRIFALRDALSLASLPFGLLITAPLAEFVLEPALMSGGALVGTLGALLGVGPGRGIALLFVLAGLLNIGVVLVAARNRRLRQLP